MSQIELAEKLGLSFQQVQKYEKGKTKLSIHRLQQISEALGVAMADFFEKGEKVPRVASPSVEYGVGGEEDRVLDREGILLVKLFRRIKNRKVREGFLRQLRGIVELEKQQ